MNKKILSKSAALLMALTMSVGIGACNSNKGPKGVVDDEKTINVRLYKAGWGEEWVYELVDNFEKAYADEGYKVNVLAPSSDMVGKTVINELMQGYDKMKVDLYISGNLTPQGVGVNGEYGVLAENLEELVFEQPAIGYNGVEEDEKISGKMPQELMDYCVDEDGTMYLLPYMQSAAGIVVNVKKLAKYDLDLPRTTNELLDCFRKIYLGHNGVGKSEESGIFPITYVPGSENGYTQCWNVNMVAQYDYKQFTELMTMQTTDEQGNVTNMTEDGYKVFDYQGLEEMLTVAYEVFDENIAAPGTLSQTLDQAQAQIMRDGGAVFMANGDWMLNEVKLNYKKYLDDIEFINTPVLSSVGTRIFGTGTSYGFDDAKCEELLCYIIDLVDANKTIEEIVSTVQENKGITITNADAQEVALARGVYYNRSSSTLVVTKGTTKKDIVAKFLRMMASEDCAKTIAELANATSAYTKEINTYAKYKFVTQSSQIITNVHAITYPNVTRGYRKILKNGSSVMVNNWGHISTAVVREGASIYDGAGALISGMDYTYYRTKAQEAKAAHYTTVQGLWADWKKNDK